VTTPELDQFQKFRQALYESFDARRDSIFNLIDALCSNRDTQSVVQLSLNPAFERQYSALYKAIGDAFPPAGLLQPDDPAHQQMMQVMAPTLLPPPEPEPWLWGLDATSYPRLYAETLLDREYVYHPTAVPGQIPVSLGHSYSVLSSLPPAEAGQATAWAVPVSAERIASRTDALAVAQQQIALLLSDQSAPWFGQFSVLTVDSRYSSREFLYPLWDRPELVVISRVRSNRVFYRQPEAKAVKGPGRPPWFGAPFKLQEPDSWPPPATEDSQSWTTQGGRPLQVTQQRWSNLLMRGSRTQPTHQRPFDLVRVQVADAAGQLVYAPMWLMIFGQQRQRLSGPQSQWFYRRRFGQEHAFRFLKGHLLLAQLQTPDVDREVNWVRLSCLAYGQLWAARHLAVHLPLPWQRYLPESQRGRIGPSQVQRDFCRIIRVAGSPARPVKQRGKSPGRLGQTKLEPRLRRPTVKKRPSQCRCAKRTASTAA